MANRPIALITGAAQGIGYACAESLSNEGYRIAMCDVNKDAVEAASVSLGKDSVAIACDMADADQINAMFDSIESEVGIPCVLVNNAGIAAPGDFLDTSLEQFRQVIDINLIGTFVATQRAARLMVEHKIQGSIINMSSINAVVAIPTIAAYCASKGGVMQLTKSSALALAPHGIRVNAVGPGSIDTAMMAGVNANPEAMNTVLSRTPLKRVGSPREIADVVTFLASDKASYVTGETIYVDGGRLGMNYTC
ncbi:MAG: SDR family NAD(P)-dependent oxidoreductase [Granulosicoccus sp.]